MGYRPNYADPELWLRPAVKLDGSKYYEYIICYIDAVICIYHNLQKLMKRIKECFKFKDDKIEPPDTYLGATISKMKLDSGNYCWTMSPEQYVKAAGTDFKEDLARSGKMFLSKSVTPLSRKYAPWL